MRCSIVVLWFVLLTGCAATGGASGCLDGQAIASLPTDDLVRLVNSGRGFCPTKFGRLSDAEEGLGS